MVARLVAYSIGSIVAVLAVGTIFANDLVWYADERAVIIFGIVLGGLTTFVKPLLKILTLPISCLTFGAFAVVLNAALFWLAARVTPDLDVSLWGAILGGIFAAVINGVLFSVVDES
jgi:putative membrane protein